MQFSFSGKWDYFLTMDTINKPCHCEPVLTLARNDTLYFPAGSQ